MGGPQQDNVSPLLRIPHRLHGGGAGASSIFGAFCPHPSRPVSRPGAPTSTANVMTNRLRSAAAGISAVAVLALAPPAAAQQLTLQQIFTSRDFSGSTFYPQWSADGQSFVMVEAGEQGGSDVWTQGIVDGKRSRVIQGSKLVAEGQTAPIEAEDIVDPHAGAVVDHGAELIGAGGGKRDRAGHPERHVVGADAGPRRGRTPVGVDRPVRHPAQPEAE